MSSFWNTVLHPDHEEREMRDRLIVISAANQLQIGEFQLLQLAYREWYDDDLPEAMVSHLFTSYMLHNKVPHWARHYARRILERHERGDLDDNARSFHRYDDDYHTSVPYGVQRFWFFATVIILALFGSIYVANQVIESPTSLLPPYFEKQDLTRTLPDMTVDKEHFIAPGGAGNFSDVERRNR